MPASNNIEERIDRLQRGGVIDLHFDLPLGLFWNRDRRGVVAQDFLAAVPGWQCSIVRRGGLRRG